ncbi:carboxypeptidase regulatory-like domain-containing protein [bacterium]|nr:carboxypeptidase regulatory-like domain-containing protein [bacterium]
MKVTKFLLPTAFALFLGQAQAAEKNFNHQLISKINEQKVQKKVDFNKISKMIEKCEETKKLPAKVSKKVVLPQESKTAPVTSSTLSGNISASVTDPNGQPVNNCELLLVNPANYGTVLTANVTGGQASFTNVPDGNYLVKTNILSNQFLGDLWYDNQISQENASIVTVAPGSNQQITFSLPVGRTVSGTVYDLITTSPISNATVSIFTTSNQFVKSTSTSANGNYTLSHVPVGTYYVYFDATSQNYAPQWYQMASSLMNATPVFVNPGNDTGGIDANLSTALTISGTVTNSAGGGLTDVSVELWDASYQSFFDVAQTDVNGFYSFQMVPSGTYSIFFNYTGSQNLSSEWFDNKGSIFNADVIQLQTSNFQANAVLEAGGSISGNVVDAVTNQPLNDLDGFVVVLLDSYSYNFIDYVFTDNNGNYSFDNVSVGNYYVYTWPIEVNAYWVPQFWPNSNLNPLAAQVISLTPGQNSPNHNFQLIKGGKISGFVTEETTGNAIDITYSGLDLKMYDQNTNLIVEFGMQEYNYNYFISIPLPAGQYYASFVDESWTFSTEFYNNKNSIATADLITFTQQTTLQNINFTLAFNGYVEIPPIVNANSDSLGGENGNYILAVLINSVTNEIVDLTADVSIFGTYFTAPTGTYKLMFLPSYSPLMPNTGNYSRIFYGGGNSLNDPLTTVFTVTNSNTTTLSQTTLPVSGGGISGNILDNGGSVIQNEDLHILTYDSNGLVSGHFGTGSDLGLNNGTYQITGLPAGSYTAVALTEGYSNQWYNNVNSNLEINETNFLVQTAPANTSTISVGNSVVSGINFGLVLGTEEESNGYTPAEFTLSQNYPNPFNPATQIEFTVPAKSNVKITVYNILGKQVKELVSQNFEAGNHKVIWNGTNDENKKVSSGIYFYQLKSSTGFSQVKRMVLIK